MNKRKAVVVGGDFSKDTISSNNCVLVDVMHGPVIEIKNRKHFHMVTVPVLFILNKKDSLPAEHPALIFQKMAV
jgi:hypothetical protein